MPTPPSWRHRDARALWRKTYGSIPSGFHIHHIDNNPHNNALENLQCLPAFDHLSAHAKVPNAKRSAAARRNQPATKAWHASPEGIAWHKVHGVEAWATREPIAKVCEVCATPYEDITRSARARFCSNNCKSEWRRRSGVDDIDRPCAVCGTPFRVSKYSRVQACGRVCGAVLMVAARKRNKAARVL